MRLFIYKSSVKEIEFSSLRTGEFSLEALHVNTWHTLTSLHTKGIYFRLSPECVCSLLRRLQVISTDARCVMWYLL